MEDKKETALEGPVQEQSQKVIINTNINIGEKITVTIIPNEVNIKINKKESLSGIIDDITVSGVLPSNKTIC